MSRSDSFGYWLRRRRKSLDLTQEELARQVGCAEVTIRKIEADERRPSRQIAKRLITALNIPATDREAFLKVARAEVAVDRLAVSPITPSLPVPQADDATAAAPTNYPDPPHVSPLVREERRWATVLYAAIAGYDVLVQQLDPEDVKRLIARYAEQIHLEIERFGGMVVSVSGDAVMAVFGLLQAHEDDPERAIRAAYALHSAPIADAFSTQIAIYIGVSTGEVLATELDGPSQPVIFGAAVTTAMRLCRAAPPGAIVVADETYRATRWAIHYQPYAEREGEPESAWEVIGVDPLPGKRPLGTAPLIGRDAELRKLEAIWTKLIRDATPHLALVLGEPGIGKSRLVAEFVQAIASEALVIHGRCLPYGEALGYAAIGMALREALGLTPEDDAATARARLDTWVTEIIAAEDSDSDPSELARHLALLSGLDLPPDHVAGPVDQRALHRSMRQFLEALARSRPLCVTLEDIHWGDTALLDLIESAAARAHDAPLLIITQARPELFDRHRGWGRAIRSFSLIRLAPLDEQARFDLALRLCRRTGLSEAVAQDIDRQAGGNPLFIEELAAMATQTGSGGVSGVPSALKSLIEARLDALPTYERRAIQIAAVFGKVFWASGLRALGTAGDVLEHLEALEDKDFVRHRSRSRISHDSEYVFKHDLIRDAAYEMLPHTARRTLHGQVADWIEHALGERVEAYFDLLAHHAVEAGQRERAIDYLSRAAERAHRAAAHREEAALLMQAIVLAEQADDVERVADLYARRGKAFADLGMWAEARPELEAALAGLAPERIAQRTQVLIDLAIVCHWVLDVPSTRRYAREALALAEEAGRGDLAAGAIGALAWADSSDGALHDSLEGFERAFARTGEIRTAQLAPSVELSGLILYWLGRSDEAIERSREALQIGRAVSDTSTTIRALGNLGLALTESGRYGEALQVFDEARRFGREYGVGTGLARAIAMCGGLHLAVFDFAGAEALAEEARELARSLNWTHPVISGGIDLLLNFARRQEVGRAEQLIAEVAEGVRMGAGAHGWLWKLRFAQARAELALAGGEWEAALHSANSAIEQGRARGRMKYQVLGLGARADARVRLGRTHAAIADLRTAVELARTVSDPALFLRAATGLLALDGDDALTAEARAAADRIVAALPNDTMRERFVTALPVRTISST